MIKIIGKENGEIILVDVKTRYNVHHREYKQ